MAKKQKPITTIPPIPEGVRLSPESEASYASYWTAVASAGDLSDSSSFSRGSRATLSDIDAQYPNLTNSPKPFTVRNGYISAQDVLSLCLDAYWHRGFALWRQTVEKMVELSNTNLILKGSSKKTQEFISEWFKKIDVRKFGSRFFRERWRSGNIFILALNGQISPEDEKKLNTLYPGINTDIPLKYMILEPQTIRARVGVNYENTIYHREYSKEEVQSLLEPKTAAEKAIVDSLDEETLRNLKRGGVMTLPIDPKNLSIVLVKNQSYEPFAVPLVWNALQNIEMKLALQNMDKIIATMGERLFLLVNVGMKNDEHNPTGMNYNTMSQLQQIFNSGAVQRVLVCDFTVKMEWITLPINELLSANKYIQVDKDLAVALNAVLFQEGEKFANTSIKVNIFVETLKEAREEFVSFLQKEVDAICQKIRSKSSPKVAFSEIDLRDVAQYEKFIQSMASIGLLTAEETFTALETGKLPSKEESEASQKEFKGLKEAGLYQPLVGNSVALQEEQMNVNQELGIQTLEQDAKLAGVPGRPAGSKAPQSKKKMTPIGASIYNEPIFGEGYSFSTLKDLTWKVSDVQNKVEDLLKKKLDVTDLDASQIATSKTIVSSIISNEPVEKWDKAVKGYINKPKTINPEAFEEINGLCHLNGIDFYAAAILRLSAIK